ncbi:hypothetical protein C0Q70_03090 [Pomacea canaliculata]|uniref:Uncharacterized protein n=1 Tax=Pomacea canaliculata TaxID=400727 RepID=A0A2T7PRW5_POMCA|nr:hypothetical protein C0Q70_03090 [Pomacea canaliculata]
MRVEVQPSGSPQPSGAAGESPVTVRPSKQRWYMLLVCFLYSMTQSCVWNTFGPISTTSKEVFDWTDANISLLSACGPIAFVLTGPVFSWIIEEKGAVCSPSYKLLVSTHID